MGSKLIRSILQFQQHLFRAFFFSQMTSCVVSLAAVFWMSRNAGGSAAWHPKNARDIMCHHVSITRVMCHALWRYLSSLPHQFSNIWRRRGLKALYFVLQNGFNSSKSSQMKYKTWKSMNEINVWQNFTFPWGKRTAAIRRKPACCRSEPPLTDIFKPQNLSKICLFFILFSRIIINVIILKQLVASGDVNMGE